MLSQQQVADASAPPMISADLVCRSLEHQTPSEMREDVPFTWQAAALTAYALEAGADGAHLRSELAARVRALNGCAVPDSAITADSSARLAVAVVDGVLFQLRGHDLRLLRTCAHCGTGRFDSPALSSRADLGHALSGWQPYHVGCEPADPASADW